MARSLAGFKASPTIARRLVEALDTVEPLEASATVLVKEVKRQLSSSSKSGMPYRKGGSKRVAAAPGRPPAKQTGRLEESIGQRLLPRKKVKTRERIRVGTFDEAAAALEFGFKSGAALGPAYDGIQPHPFIRPAVKAAESAMTSAFKLKLKYKGTRSAKARMKAFRARQAAIRPRGR